MKRLFSYVLRYDSGFAPNPFGRYCTLVCCKPKIRKYAKTGDWVIGTGSVENVGNNKLIYAMEITEKMSFHQYSKDDRLKYKIPKEGLIEERGDNIYYYKKDKIKQRTSYHTYSDYYSRRDLFYANNLYDPQALISTNFIYFGNEAVIIPERFSKIIKKGPGHKIIEDKELILLFLNWYNSLLGATNKKRRGNPFKFIEEIKNEFKHC